MMPLPPPSSGVTWKEYEIDTPVLRSTPETASLGILAWTGHFVKQQDEIRALRAGADDFVSKDTEFGLIEAKIEALLRRISRTRI
jgi:DNA-binding response OmpR family regulator